MKWTVAENHGDERWSVINEKKTNYNKKNNNSPLNVESNKLFFIPISFSFVNFKLFVEFSSNTEWLLLVNK